MNRKLKTIIGIIAIAVIGTLAGIGITININQGGEVNTEVETKAINANIEYADEQIPAAIEGDLGETIETTEIDGVEIPTVEEIDGGGLFEDYQSVTHDLTTDVYYDAGAIESVDTSSVEAFKNSTLGRCIIANNYYGAQCVSLARAFWFSYANRDVSTCGTGLAKGMMNCWEQNAGSEFKTIWNTSEIIAGTFIVTGGSYTGHICMALGPEHNGYVTCLGENQGGASCGANIGGSATNIINLSLKNFIGGYIPKSYIPKPAPKPEPTPAPADQCKVWNVKKGDTLGKIMKTCEGEIKWGEAMNEYARHWYSTTFQIYLTVFDGWTSTNRVGLFAGDTIEYRNQFSSSSTLIMHTFKFSTKPRRFLKIKMAPKLDPPKERARRVFLLY